MSVYKYFFAIIITISMMSTHCNRGYKNIFQPGIYYGTQGGFPLPSQIVFADNQDSICIVNCYFPLKGVKFILIEDTLIRTINDSEIFRGKQSSISFINDDFFFSSDSALNGYKIENVIIENDPEKIDQWDEYRSRSVPW